MSIFNIKYMEMIKNNMFNHEPNQEQKEKIKKIDFALGQFPIYGMSAKIVNNKVAEFLEDYEFDESDRCWSKSAADAWRKLGLNIEFEPDDYGKNDGYLFVKKRELNKLINFGIIEIIKDDEPGSYGDVNENEQYEVIVRDFSAAINQATTRGEGKLEIGELFDRDTIDFGSALEHIKIHHEGGVAGSQFNRKIIGNPQELEKLIRKLLPQKLNYDQYGRAEITLDISHINHEPIGWSGVKSIKEIQNLYPKPEIQREIRIPGGVEAIEDGIEGAWYPEVDRNPKTGQLEIIKDEAGKIKNPKGKFEPKANIAYVEEETYKVMAKTNKITIIIQKDKQTQAPTVLTVFPGENAPMFPAKINSEDFKLDTLKEGPSAEYWRDHAFIQLEK